MEIKNSGMPKCKQRLIFWLSGKRNLISDNNLLVCPRCGSKMDKIEKSFETTTVTIDLCPYCKGVFLDDGEGDKLRQVAKGKTTVKKSRKRKK